MMHEKSAENPLPCPWCGSVPAEMAVTDTIAPGGPMFRVCCGQMGCRAVGPGRATSGDAVRDWNSICAQSKRVAELEDAFLGLANSDHSEDCYYISGLEDGDEDACPDDTDCMTCFIQERLHALRLHARFLEASK